METYYDINFDWDKYSDDQDLTEKDVLSNVRIIFDG